MILLPSAFHRPSSIVHLPSSIVHRPSSIVHRPSSIVHRPSRFTFHASRPSIVCRQAYAIIRNNITREQYNGGKRTTPEGSSYTDGSVFGRAAEEHGPGRGHAC